MLELSSPAEKKRNNNSCCLKAKEEEEAALETKLVRTENVFLMDCCKKQKLQLVASWHARTTVTCGQRFEATPKLIIANT